MFFLCLNGRRTGQNYLSHLKGKLLQLYILTRAGRLVFIFMFHSLKICIFAVFLSILYFFFVFHVDVLHFTSTLWSRAFYKADDIHVHIYVACSSFCLNKSNSTIPVFLLFLKSIYVYSFMHHPGSNDRWHFILYLTSYIKLPSDRRIDVTSKHHVF